ncbi:MAG TPA: hypothetical protein VK673_19370 [Chthoniobacterales bacterium]|nr:hypothetical protein [Verrucomicrobiota bacterium]HTD17355.1 hypothetical protein [Chthoniobacterales bacterium]
MTNEAFVDYLDKKKSQIERALPILEQKRARRSCWKVVLGAVNLGASIVVASKLAFQLSEDPSLAPIMKFLFSSLALLAALCSGTLTFSKLPENADAYATVVKQLRSLARWIELNSVMLPETAKGRAAIAKEIKSQLGDLEKTLPDPFPFTDGTGQLLLLGEDPPDSLGLT